jgi:DNA-binding beta-propeller fold protein YncE
MGVRRFTFTPLFALLAGFVLDAGCASGADPGFAGNDQFNPPQPPGGGCCGEDAGEAPVDHPTFNPLVTASTPPPPISGGTLLVTADGKTAVAADSDRDVVHLVDLASQKVTFNVGLQPGDEPGRVVEDGAGHIHVALRGGGAVVTIDPTQGVILGRRSVCPAPRGLAWDAASDTIFVACATGELVSLPAGGGAPTRTVVVERDLRDVIDQGGVLSVTKFRSAEVLRLAPDGSIANRFPLLADPQNASAVPHVAWRAIAAAGGGILVVHQVASTQSVDVQTPHGYGGGGGGPGIVDSLVTEIASDGTPVGETLDLSSVVLPVDVARSPSGKVAVASPGTAFFSQLGTVALSTWPDALIQVTQGAPRGQAVAVAFADDDHLVVQSREPAELWIMNVADPSAVQSKTVTLSSVSRDDSGHDIFHVQAGAAVACASCHPEGGDDGHVWTLSGDTRRTPSLRGTIAGTEPYHWLGNQPDITTLVNEVYTRRMNGMALDGSQIGALRHWVEAIPAPPAPSWVDMSSAQSGHAIFTRADVGCSGCHSGPKLTNNATVSVGTGGTFQVPPLVGVGWRTPLLHDGCAATIADRFGACATTSHGDISKLTPQDLADLGAYLETL